MNILKRISNMWKLSSYEPEMRRLPIQFSDGSQVVDLVKKPVKKPVKKLETVFIPRVKIDPVKELTSQV